MKLLRAAVWICTAAAAVVPGDVTVGEAALLHGDPPVTHKIVFEVSEKIIDEEEQRVSVTRLGALTVGLFGTVVPKTVENFVHLANATYGYGYKGTKFHRIIKNFMVQTGDFKGADGSPSRSIYGEHFDDENFTLQHNKRGRLSMANAGPNTNSAQFFITTQESCAWLDGHHVVFGQLLDGFDTLGVLNDVPTSGHDVPLHDVFFSDVQIVNLLETNHLLDPQTEVNPQIDTIPAPTSGYHFLYTSLVVVAILYLVKRIYFRRQYITDIKDVNFF